MDLVDIGLGGNGGRGDESLMREKELKLALPQKFVGC